MSEPGEHDALSAAYRRASDAEAGRPSARTREAILAEARRAAAARAPAANDARFRWQWVAGVAIVGFALVLWRQLPRDATARLEGTAPVVATDLPPPAATSAPPPALTPAPTPTQDVAAEAAARSRQAEGNAIAARQKARESEAAAVAPPAASARVAPPPPAAAPVIVDLDLRQPVPESTADLPRTAQAFGAARVGVEALVRREFPDLLGSATPPPGVWIVVTPDGRALRSGTLASGESLGSVLSGLQREIPGRRLRPFEITQMRTATGAAVPVGISRAE